MQDRWRRVGPPRHQRGARQHREQNDKYLELGFHGFENLRLSIRAEARRGQYRAPYSRRS
jgi:hypothetical protein